MPQNNLICSPSTNIQSADHYSFLQIPNTFSHMNRSSHPEIPFPRTTSLLHSNLQYQAPTILKSVHPNHRTHCKSNTDFSWGPPDQQEPFHSPHNYSSPSSLSLYLSYSPPITSSTPGVTNTHVINTKHKTSLGETQQRSHIPFPLSFRTSTYSSSIFCPTDIPVWLCTTDAADCLQFSWP